VNRAVIFAARQVIEPLAHHAVAAHQGGFLHCLQLPDGADAVALQRGREGLADAPDQRHGSGRQERQRLLLADHREAARLVEIGSDLGEKLAVGQTDRKGDADLGLDPGRKARQRAGRGVLVKPLGARKIQERLIDRDRLHQGRQFLHHPPDLSSDPDIFLHVGLDDDRVGAGVERLEHRHRRAHPVNARDVAAGRDHAALAAADDHRFVGELRIVALFHRCVEGITVHVRQCQFIDLRMPDEPGAAAGMAALCLAARWREAVAAKARNRI
jgi:hypothetical protein